MTITYYVTDNFTMIKTNLVFYENTAVTTLNNIFINIHIYKYINISV